MSHRMRCVELNVAAEKLISARRGLTRTAVCRAPAHILDTVEVAMVDSFLAEFGDELTQVAL